MLSIVVALAEEPPASVPPALAALAPRCLRKDRELIVVAAVPGRARGLGGRFPGLRVLESPAGGLVPELWAAGIRAARGDAVALTIGECAPEAGWDERLEAALWTRDLAAVGGAIEPPPPGARLADWAMYFCRYSAYGRPLRADAGLGIAGDSSAYRTADLMEVAESWSEGFWEPEVHRALSAAGRRVGFEADAAVRFQGGASPGSFLRARVAHGRRYGADRARRFGPARRAAQVALAPAVPFVLWGRAAGRVLRRGRGRGRFVAASPLLLPFFAAWAVGELAGTVAGPGAKDRGGRSAVDESGRTPA